MIRADEERIPATAYTPKQRANLRDIANVACSYWNGRKWVLTSQAVLLLAAEIRAHRHEYLSTCAPNDAISYLADLVSEPLPAAMVRDALNTISDFLFADSVTDYDPKARRRGTLRWRVATADAAKERLQEVLQALGWVLDKTKSCETSLTFYEACVAAGLDADMLRDSVKEIWNINVTPARRALCEKWVHLVDYM